MAITLLMSLITTYPDYFARADSSPYEKCYVKAVGTYNINVMKHTTAITLQDLNLQLFASTKSGYPTELLLWLVTPSIDAANDPGQMMILHTASQYNCR